MGSENDEIRRPGGRLLDDDVRGPSREALDAQRVDADPVAAARSRAAARISSLCRRSFGRTVFK
jgi:hypothetical protein